MQVFYIFIAAVFSNNYVLSQLLGIYPAIDAQRRRSSMVREGLYMTLAMVILSIIGHTVYKWILNPLEVDYMTTSIMFLLLFVAAQLTVLISNKAGMNSIGITAGRIMANSAILAVILFSIDNGIDSEYALLDTIGNALGAGAGYTLISVLLADVIDKIDENLVVPAFRGFPLQLISLGLMAYAFWGFCCLVP